MSETQRGVSRTWTRGEVIHNDALCLSVEITDGQSWITVKGIEEDTASDLADRVIAALNGPTYGP